MNRVKVAVVGGGCLMLIWILPVRHRVGLKLEQYQLRIGKPTRVETMDSIGQTGVLIALGGFRTLVAAALNIQTWGAYEDRDWEEVERLYRIMVLLQPRVLYYWDLGAWQLAYNAFYDCEVSTSRGRLQQKLYFEQGRDLLLQGVVYHPDSPLLWSRLGRLYLGSHRFRDPRLAARYFRKAAFRESEGGRARREYFYALSRLRGQKREALEWGQKLMLSHNHNRFSTVKSCYYALAMTLQNQDELLLEVWGGRRKRAYRDLVNYWLQAPREGFSRASVGEVIQELAEDLEIPSRWNPLQNQNLKRISAGF